MGGASGLLGTDGCHVAVVPYDRAWFEEVLAAVQLQPEDAVGAEPSPSP